MQLITHSRQNCFKVCRRKHWFEYELGIRRVDAAKALRIGIAFHAALEHDSAWEIDEAYKTCPESVDFHDWDIERETVIRLFTGHQWRWHNMPLKRITTEQAFRIPLVNPATGMASRIFDLAGVIDGIIELEDDRLAVHEYKTSSDSLDSDAELWRRLRIDQQITLYVYAARQLGFNVDCVLYDVTRKPTIKPTDVPLLDSDDLKIVFDEHGGRVYTKQNKPRQTGDKAKGYTLQVRPMTVAEWGNKLTTDIWERPDYYYARMEVPRLDQDIDECIAELWEIQKTMRDAQLNNRHYRTCNKDTCSWCSYFDLCTTGFNPESDSLPEGFERVSNVHPELGDTENDSSPSSEDIETESTATTA